jgi:hypothetical protein
METFAQRFPTARVNYWCADREFIGQAWVRYLRLEPALAFRLRIRSSAQIEPDGKVLAARVVFAHLLPGQSQRLTGTCRVWGYPVAVEALRLEEGELLVVIAPPKTQDLVKDNALRWGMETLELLRESRRESQFKADNCRNQVEAQPEMLASISIALSQNPKDLEFAVDMLSDHSQSG